MPSLFVIRHGESRANAEGILQGPRIDAALSELGRRQAEALRQAFDSTPLDAIYASPMLRARDTADAVARAQPGRTPMQVVPELYEMDFGDLCGRRVDEAQDELGATVQAWRMGFFDRPFPGGESPVLVAHRLRGLVARLQAHAAQDAAVVAHGRVNKILLTMLRRAGFQDMDGFPQANANITHLEWGPHGIDVRRLNDTSHLEDLGGPRSGGLAG